MQQTIEGFRLSPQQVRLWLLQQQSNAYRAYCSLLIRGSLHVATLQAAIEAVIARNEMYRTGFRRLPGIKIPIQVINEDPLYTWQHCDLRNCEPQEQDRKIEEISQEGGEYPIDIEQGPFVRCCLLTLTAQQHILFVHLHSLHADSQTLHNLAREIAQLYSTSSTSLDQGDEVAQYLQFSEWQNSLLEEEDAGIAREYWRKKDISAFSTMALPFESKRDVQDNFVPDFLIVSISPALCAQIEALLEQQQSTLPVFLLTCWQILLWRLIDRNAILIGLAVHGRIYEELIGTTGLIAKDMPLFCHLAGHQLFCELLVQVKEARDELLTRYPYFTWEVLGDFAEPTTASLLYPFSFDFREQPAAYAAQHVSFTLQQCYTCYEPFKVKIVAVKSSTELAIEFHYQTGLFDRQDIQRLAAQFATLIESAVRQPETRISRLELLSPPERRQLLLEFNQTKADYPKDRCIHHLFEQQVMYTPDAIAVQEQGSHLSYQQLNVRANQVAHHLRTLSVGPEMLVGMYLERSMELVIGTLGILKTGAAYLPLDPLYPRERLTFITTDARVQVLLTRQRFLDQLPQTAEVVCLDTNWAIIARQDGEQSPTSSVIASNLAYVIYTSGSTGQPKGVMISHQGLVHYVSWCSQSYDVATGTGSPVHSPLAFDLTITSLFSPLVVGRRVVLVSEQQGIEALGNVLREGNDFSLIKITPAHLDMLSQYLHPEELASAARALIIGGEALRGESLTTWRLHAPATRIVNEYGPTETVVGCCIYEIPCEGQLHGNIPIGRPIANTQLYLLDAQLQPVPIGVSGELHIGGIGLGRGYLNRPDLTAERFIANPFATELGSRLYKTGDLARYVSPDGNLEYLGRIDRQVKLRGYRIELEEIEAVLLHHPNVREGVVMLREDEPGHPQLVAYIVPEHQPPPSHLELCDFLQGQLPTYMVPSAAVSLGVLPLTANGKVDRQLLPPPSSEASQSSIPPRGPIEEILVSIWEEVLKVKSVGIHDNFFHLGGHSLLATQFIARLRSIFQIELPLTSLFDAPTVAELAQQVEQLLCHIQRDELPPLVPVVRDSEMPLSFAQQRLWFLDQLEPGSSVYLIPSARHLRGALDTVALERSLQELVRRHESLRTTFQVRASQPVQVIQPASTFRLPLIDLQALKHEVRPGEARRLAGQEKRRPCDLEQGPLLRVSLLRLDTQEHMLLMTMHHIISDAWSNDVFGRELMILYRAFAAGQPSPLPPLPIQYADFAVWQRQWLQGEVLEAQLSYWKRQLEDLSPLELPIDHPRPPVQTFRGAYQTLLLPLSLHEGLIALSQQEDVTLFMLLLAAFQVLLARYTSQRDISVGTSIANRTQAELEGVIGFFINTLVLRTRLAYNPCFVQVLKQVREVALGAYAHQDVPFEQLVEVLQPGRDLSRSPLFQVMFVMQHISTVTEPQQERQQESRPSRLSIEHSTTKFDLTLTVVSSTEGLRCGVEYNTDLFETDTIGRLLEHWQTLLEGILAHPEYCLADLPLLSAAQRRRMLVDWNATPVALPASHFLHRGFELQVQQVPDAIALVYEEHHLTYVALHQRANQLAHYLQDQGVAPEVLVGICLPRSLEMVIGLLGILKAGGAYVPLDPTVPKERLRFLTTEANLFMIVTTQTLAHAVMGELSDQVQVLYLDRQWPALLQQCDQQPVCAIHSDNLAYVIFTSGSTGRPKGVMISQQGLLNYVQWCAQHYQVEAGRGSAVHSSIGFDLTVTSLFAPLLVGRTVFLVPEQQGIEGLANLLCQRNGLSLLKLTPAHLDVLNHTLSVEQLSDAARALIIGGEALSAESVLAWRRHAPSTRLINEYGPTETVVGCCIYEVALEDPETGMVPIGRPIANTQLYILDEHGQPVPIGVPGELYIGGQGLARGYVNRADLTVERFLPDPFSEEPGARLYKSGDLARYRGDATIEYLGRRDQQVKIRGYRIEPGEIEAVLKQHSNVREGVVLLRENGAGERCLVAYVVARQQPEPDSKQLCDFLLEYLPEYMMPSAVMVLDTLPLTANGKVNRRTLPSPVEPQKEEHGRLPAPRTPVEEMLGEMWSEVLGRSSVNIYDNFFESGGHSLLAARLISRVRAVLQVEIPLRSLFESPTIAALGQWVEQALRGGHDLEAPPLVPKERTQNLPLSFAQQRLWFLDQLEPESAVYLMPSARRLQGVLDAVALERSLAELIRRHESLRTTFQVRAGQPVQVIHPAGCFHLPLVDLCGLGQEEQVSHAQLLAGQEAQRPCDLREGPLLRLWLLRLDPQEHVLLATMHHIISDGWSNDVFVRELSTLYRAFTARQPSPLPPLPIQYADFALWQRDWLQGKVLEAQLAYWKRQLADGTVLELPTDHPRPALQTFRGALQAVQLPLALHRRLIALSQQEGVTLFMVLLAAFQVLLARYSDRRDISVGTPIANRTHAELEGLIGFFVNTLVLRTDLSGNPSFMEVLARVREVALGAYTHQNVPFEQLVEVLQPERDLSRSPLFQVMFVMQQVSALADDPPAPQPRHEEPQPSAPGFKHSTTKFDLTLSVVSGTQGLDCAVEYNTDLFEAGTISRLLEHWQCLLQAIVAAPQTRLNELALLSVRERACLLHDWNASRLELPPEQCVHVLIEAQVEQHPDAIALVYEEQQLSYAALNRQANQLAHYLQGLGVGPERLVGVCLPRSLELVVALLGILKAGGAYVPFDPECPAQRLADMLAGLLLHLLLVQERLQGQMSEQSVSPVGLEMDWEKIAAQPQTNLPQVVSPANLAYVIYTSGSTGRPKGVLISHRNLVHSTVVRLAYFEEPVSSFLLLSPLFFDSSVAGLYWTLCQGGRLVLPQEDFRYDLSQLPRLIARYDISHMLTIPSLYAVILQQAYADHLSSLRTVIVAGEACPVALVQQHRKVVPAASFYNEYGPTEGTVWCSVYQDQGEELVSPVSIGWPIANMQIYLLDQGMQPVPIGVAGELYIGGLGVARGYLNDGQGTAEKFTPHPFSEQPGARLYRTGDLARYRANGSIEFLGRRDQQVKLRGYRIELGEIEEALRRHPNVWDDVVLLREDVIGEPRLIGYVVAREQPAPTSKQLHDFVQKHLPEYMIPVTFVLLESLPLTVNGKVDRRHLPKPEAGQRDRDAISVVPHRPVEEILLDMWKDLLAVPSIGVHDNFFALGGHSLLVTQLVSRVRATLQVEVPLRSLFEEPTIAGLAQRVEQALRGGQGLEAPALVPVERSEALPLSFAQQRLWFLDQLDPHSTAYLIPSVQRLHGVLDAMVLERSLAELVQRHESLRTTFQVRAGQPLQVIHPAGHFHLPLIDLHELGQEVRVRQARRLSEQEAELPCDLLQGPLLRVSLLRLDPREHVVLLTMHHIISDAWSSQVFFNELTTLYLAFVAGQPSPLPPLPLQYADFALWQRQWLQGEVLEHQLNYWKSHLRDPLPILHLPADRPRPPVQSFRGSVHFFRLPRSLAIDLKTLGQREGTTLFMTLLAAFQILLHSYTGQDDIVVGTDVANRNQVEIEGLIGFFINQLVLRTDLAGNPGFRDLLRRVREVALGAYAHQDLPFDRLVEALKPERSLSRTPLFQVKFVLQNVQARVQPLSHSTTRLPEPEERTAKFDLLLNMSESDDTLSGALEYNTDIFDRERIIRMIGHFECILKQVVASPDARLDLLETVIASADREEQRAREQELQQVSLQKLGKVRRKVHQTAAPKEGLS